MKFHFVASKAWRKFDRVIILEFVKKLLHPLFINYFNSGWIKLSTKGIAFDNLIGYREIFTRRCTVELKAHKKLESKLIKRQIDRQQYLFAGGYNSVTTCMTMKRVFTNGSAVAISTAINCSTLAA